MSSQVITGDCLESLRRLPDESVHCCVTSPPYWGLRDYGIDGQLGMESSPDEYVHKMTDVFREVMRVLRNDGTLWLNLGDSYSASVTAKTKTFGNPDFNGTRPSREATLVPSRTIPVYLKAKDLVGIPWLVAFALRADGWYLRQDIIWAKPNPMPESVKDRCTRSHEYIFLLSKASKYYYDATAIEEPAKWERWGDQTENKKHPGTANHLGGKLKSELPIRDKKNKRDVWWITPQPFRGAHFATYPQKLVEPCILAGCPLAGTVIDPFSGSGTTGVVAKQLGRNYIGLELNPEYAEMSRKRIAETFPEIPPPEPQIQQTDSWLEEL